MMTAKIKIGCPHCRKLLRIAAQRYQVGKSYPCPSCGRPVIIPDLDSAEEVPLDAPEVSQSGPTSWVSLEGIGDNYETPHADEVGSGWAPSGVVGDTPGAQSRPKPARPPYPDDSAVLPPFPGLFAFAERLEALLPNRLVTLHTFWWFLGLLILLGEGAGIFSALLIFVGSSLIAVGTDAPLLAIAGLLGSVAVVGITYVGSLFARAAVRWVYDTPLTVQEGVVFDAIGILLATCALGLCVTGFVLSILQLGGPATDLAGPAIPIAAILGGRTGLFVNGAGWWFLAWVVLRKDLLGLKITESTDGQGSRLLAQAAALWQTVLRLLVLGSIWGFGINTCFAASTLGLAGLQTVLHARGEAIHGPAAPAFEMLSSFPTVLAFLSALLAPVGAYFVYVVGSTVPELLILLSRLEFNTRRSSTTRDEPV